MACRGLRLGPLVAVLAATSVQAGGDTSVELRVVDAAGRPLPRAEATLVSTDEAGAACTARAGAGGTLAFLDIPPGTYRIRIEHDGLAPVSAEVRLGPGETAWLTAALSGGEGSSHVEGSPPDAVGYGTTFDAEALRDLPSSRDAWSLIETAEGASVVDRIDNGGLWAGQAPRLDARGGSFAQTSIRLGDADLTGPRGAPLMQPVLDGTPGLEIATALLPMREAGAGPLVVLRPPRPGRAWHGGLEGLATTAGMQSEAPDGPPPVARYDSWRHGAFSIGGPLVPQRLGLALAGSATDVARRERDDGDPRDAQARSLLVHLAESGPRNEAHLTGLVQDVRGPDPARALLGDESRRRDDFVHLQAGWQRRGQTGGVAEIMAAWTQLRSTAQGRREATVGTVEPLADGPIPDMLLDGPGSSRRAEGALTLRTASRRWGPCDHAIAAGVQAAGERTELFASGPVSVGELVGGLPARVWEFAPRDAVSSWPETRVAIHVADRMRFGSRARVEAGARIESTRAAAGGPVRISWLEASPRLRGRARLDDGGRWAVFGGWARLPHRLPASLLAFGDPTAPAATVSRWLDDGDRRFAPGETGPLVAVAGPGGPHSSIDPALAPPRTDELVLGLEARVGERAVVRLAGIDRRGRNLVESVNVGVGADRYRTFTISDPGGDLARPDDDQQLTVYDRDPSSFGADQYLLTNPDGLATRFQAVELVVDLRPAAGLRIRLGAAAHRAEGRARARGFRSDENDPGLPGELFDDPNAGTFADGRLFFDRAYTIKLAAWYHAGGLGPRVGAIARYQDGQPFARIVVVPGLAQGAEAVRAIPNGRSRFAYTLTVDARAEQGVGLGRTRLSAVAEGFNLLGTAHEVEEDVLTGAGFRTPTAQQPPRALRLGLRLDF